MGPVMNLALAVVLLAVVLYQGAEVPVYQDQPAVVGAVTPDSPRPRPTSAAAIAIVSVADRRVDTWEQFFIAVGTRPNREVTITLNRQGNELARQVTPGTLPDSKYEIGDIGVLPDVHPHVPRVTPGEPADKAGIKPGDVILDINGEPIVLPIAARRDHRETYRQADHRHRPPPGRASQLHRRPDQGLHRGRRRSGVHRRRTRRGDQEGPARRRPGGRHERPPQRRDDAADPRHDLGIDHTPDVAEAADGAGRHRAAVGRVGAARLDRALQPDGAASASTSAC